MTSGFCAAQRGQSNTIVWPQSRQTRGFPAPSGTHTSPWHSSQWSMWLGTLGPVSSTRLATTKPLSISTGIGYLFLDEFRVLRADVGGEVCERPLAFRVRADAVRRPLPRFGELTLRCCVAGLLGTDVLL